VNEYLEIQTPLVISSTIPIDHELKGELKVRTICKERKADVYYNPIGGLELYSKEVFKNDGIELLFLKTNFQPYPQFKNEFVPGLSIIDVMMFNSKDQVQQMLHSYTLQ